MNIWCHNKVLIPAVGVGHLRGKDMSREVTVDSGKIR